jgi:uncharacterized protein (TIGR03067 family)
MRVHGLMLVAVASLIAADEPKKDDAQKDLKKLQGTWTIVAVEVNGEKMSDEDSKNVGTKMTLKGDKYSIEGGERNHTGTFKVHPDKKPKAMDCMPDAGDLKGKTIQAIYEIKGDKVKICYDISCKTRPEEFATKDKEGYVLIEYQRAKKKAK